jgi:hypothetical protein
VVQGVGPEFKPQYHKINKNKMTNDTLVQKQMSAEWTREDFTDIRTLHVSPGNMGEEVFCRQQLVKS